MCIKQSSAGLVCRCNLCHGIFKLFSYSSENGVVSTQFECDCGRVIKVKESKLDLFGEDGELDAASYSSEVEK